MVPHTDLPTRIFLECDWGATWPTWVPNGTRNSAGRERTNYLPMDRFGLPDDLRDRLTRWQRRWESLSGPPESEHRVETEAWNNFLHEGRQLADDLAQALGGETQVIIRLRERR